MYQKYERVMCKTLLPRLMTFILLLSAQTAIAQKGQFLTADDFYAQSFNGEFQAELLWLNKSLLDQAEQILGHRFRGMRTRFKAQVQVRGQETVSRTAWIFEEIGKIHPITIGVVVEGRGQEPGEGVKASDQIVAVKILEFRESRGGEVRYRMFTDQFSTVALQAGGLPKLDQSIDGITGATLSVRAVKKVATLALFFHRQTSFSAFSKTTVLKKSDEFSGSIAE